MTSRSQRTRGSASSTTSTPAGTTSCDPTLAQMADAVGEAAGHDATEHAWREPDLSLCPGCRARAEAMERFEERDALWRELWALIKREAVAAVLVCEVHGFKGVLDEAELARSDELRGLIGGLDE